MSLLESLNTLFGMPLTVANIFIALMEEVFYFVCILFNLLTSKLSSVAPSQLPKTTSPTSNHFVENVKLWEDCADRFIEWYKYKNNEDIELLKDMAYWN